MARARRKVPLSALRITAYVKEKFDGNTREAARVIGVDHVMLWRAQQGYAVRGPSADLCEKLEAHSGQPMRYWRGRAEP